ncbi:MAG: hypothetical protein ACSHW7_02205 [Patiriisocius sp.]|uniref:hypothetical protein n=1 Tax=Patiriisocius sp. TaxID=2822396 RepID=UPI003EF6A751
MFEEATAQELNKSFLDILPKDYSEVSFKKLDSFRQDRELLSHWESIFGMVTIADGEILRYILHNKIPIDRIICHELALRGFDKAREIWLI